MSKCAYLRSLKNIAVLYVEIFTQDRPFDGRSLSVKKTTKFGATFIGQERNLSAR